MISTGTRLGHYIVEARIGAGGMGEVYRARDSRLDRTVALKIIAGNVFSRLDLRTRFEREARLVSQLSHPNICQLFDVGEAVTPSDGESVPYLVMEYLEGQTLAQRLAAGPLPAREALSIATAIASALDRAHRRGIIHRDLKPGNIVLTRSGPKLLDFGLARPTGLSHGGDASEHADTAALPLTAEGTVVGTPSYMSPEQVRGDDVDGRSDLFSLGTVLYEMLTGKRAFTGSSSVETMHSILRDPPPPVEPRMIPPHSFALQAAANFSSGSYGSVSEQRPFSRLTGPRAAAVAAIVLLIGAATALLIVRMRVPLSEPRAREVTRFAIPFADDASITVAAISPDGRTLAFVRNGPDGRHLYLRSLDTLDDVMVPDSSGATSPFFSPDGQWVAFAAGERLRKVHLESGRAVSLAQSGALNGGSWGSDGSIVYSSAKTGTLFLISERGGQPKEISKLDSAAGEAGHTRPQILPGSRTVLFRRYTGFGLEMRSRIEALDLRTGTRREVLPGTNTVSFRYIPEGYLLFTQQGRLMVVPFDAERAAATGRAASVLESVDSYWPLQVSASGTLLFRAVRPVTNRVMHSTAGVARPLSLPPKDYRALSLSPDELQISLTYIESDGTMQIGVADSERGGLSRLTFEGESHLGVCTPDSQHLIYTHTRDASPSNIYRQRTDGGGDPERLTTSPHHQDPTSVSSDGRWLAYSERTDEHGWDIWLLPFQEPRTPRLYRRTRTDEFSPAISPDGRWIAYTSNEAGRRDVYLDSFPIPGRRTRISADGGTDPLWAASGRYLFYRTPTQVLRVDASALPRTGAAVPIIEGAQRRATMGYGPPSYAMKRDGSMLLVEDAERKSILVGIANWTTELEEQLRSSRK